MAFGDSAQSGKYLQVKTATELAVLGDEISGYASFDEYKKRYVQDLDGSFRFGVHVWSDKKVSLLEGGWRLFKAIKDAVIKHGADTVLLITPVGEGLSKSFTAEEVRKLTPEEQTAIAESERWDLAKVFGWAKGAEVKVDENDNVPF